MFGETEMLDTSRNTQRVQVERKQSYLSMTRRKAGCFVPQHDEGEIITCESNMTFSFVNHNAIFALLLTTDNVTL